MLINIANLYLLPVLQGQSCPDEKCGWAHNAFELWLHPERYKTIMCRKGAACGRGICFFAHSEAGKTAQRSSVSAMGLMSYEVT